MNNTRRGIGTTSHQGRDIDVVEIISVNQPIVKYYDVLSNVVILQCCTDCQWKPRIPQ